MAANRNHIVYQHIIDKIAQQQLPHYESPWSLQQAQLTVHELLDLFESQVMSRHLDLYSREMQRQGESFYTIGSAGHEGNAAIAKAFRVTDPAFLHYRSGAFFIQRSKQIPGQTPLWDMLLSFAASRDDPISGGRHKVLGSLDLTIPPQTSTIASHLPKAVGSALSIPLAQRLQINSQFAKDSVVVCSFGDASANHSTAQGAFNTSAWTAFQHVPLPLVWVCEDNGIGISTPTPSGWIAANFKNRPGLVYLSCNGLDVIDTYYTSCKAVKIAREQRKPVFLHVKTVRLLGHAGSDAEIAYLPLSKIEANESDDPLLYTASLLIQNGIEKEKLIGIYQQVRERIEAIAQQVIATPKLTSAQAIMTSLVPPKQVYQHSLSSIDRTQLFQNERHNINKKQPLAKLINWTLRDLMASYPEVILCGEDVGKKGGVYHVTAKLIEAFGANRVINTLLDEQSILGLGIGLAHNGFLPIPEIQFLAYVHNAEDQIRGEAATLSFFSKGQYDNPMIIRIAGLAYQKGFGGHFHNDNSLAVFRDIPGLIIACPSNGADAVEMLRACVKVALEERRVIIFIEPIALYMQRDLLPNDGRWSFDYVLPEQSQPILPGEISCHGQGPLSIISYGNGYYLSRQAAALLAEQDIFIQVIDLRWLAPLNKEAIIDAVKESQVILIVDECRETGSISEALVTLLHEAKTTATIERITAADSFIPLGKAAYEVLPSCDQIINTVSTLLKTLVLENHAE